ncbi:hypothetical protein QVD17_04906 [Tagetes erecta]|uniref:DUF4378 domain-containing protein n=1 Tax=Tagetes erecta TaxID=13708 RepID=A0AAD8LHJ6_TARER|nr:hypothetical protein QVD17_04906 [Tagetes erecta]
MRNICSQFIVTYMVKKENGCSLSIRTPDFSTQRQKMDDSASVTTSSLAVAEKRPRRSGGCVGIFFHLFDWNRRFSKKNIFSKRLLPPDRSKKLGGGDENLRKLKLIADENRGSFPNKNINGVSCVEKNGVQTPSLVARLMGLESMPTVQQKPTKQDFRPQKLQKTGMVDRKSVTRFGAEALQLKNVLSRSRKHHHPKLASPVQNTNQQSKRNSSRLIGAATRVLESGLQARNKSKYAITYRARNPMKGENLDSSSQQASCKNCGNFINISESKSKRDVNSPVLKFSYDQEQVSKPQTFASPKENSEIKDFVASKRSVTGQTRSRVPAKHDDTRLDNRGKFENRSAQWQNRRLTRNRSRMVSNDVSTGKQMRSEARKPDYQGQVGNKNTDGTMFKFNSQTKNRCEIATRLERRRNNQNATSSKTASDKNCSSKMHDEKICLQKPFSLTGASLRALVDEKLRELVSRVGYDSRINGNPPQRRNATVFQDMLRALSMERQITQNDVEFSPKRKHLTHHSRCRYDDNNRFCLQANLQKAAVLMGHKNSDHLSPGSVLEASFSNESCCSSSLEDSSVRTHRADQSTSYTYEESQFQESETNPFYSDVLIMKENTQNKLVVDLLTYISQALSTMDIVHSRIKGHQHAHIKHIIFNSELVLSNQMPHNPNELNPFFICDLLLELDTLAEVIQTTFGNFLGSQNSVAGYQQVKRFVFDAVIEYLESKYVQYSECGFRGWITLTRFTGFDSLVHEVVEEVRRWMGAVGQTSDELVERDMIHWLGKWADFEVEVYETGAKIGSEILQMLVDEIVVDVKGFGF